MTTQVTGYVSSTYKNLSNPPKITPNSQPTSNNSTESLPQSSLPCGQRTPAALTSSSDVPTPQTPPRCLQTHHINHKSLHTHNTPHQACTDNI